MRSDSARHATNNLLESHLMREQNRPSGPNVQQRPILIKTEQCSENKSNPPFMKHDTIHVSLFYLGQVPPNQPAESHAASSLRHPETEQAKTCPRPPHRNHHLPRPAMPAQCTTTTTQGHPKGKWTIAIKCMRILSVFVEYCLVVCRLGWVRNWSTDTWLLLPDRHLIQLPQLSLGNTEVQPWRLRLRTVVEKAKIAYSLVWYADRKRWLETIQIENTHLT